MVKEIIYYDIICDRCDKSLTEESEMCYPDTESAELISPNNGWIPIDECITIPAATIEENGRVRTKKGVYND